MLTLFFIIVMLVVFGKLAALALKAAWGIAKIFLTIVFLPAAIILLAVSGFMGAACLVLLGTGAAALIGGR